MDEDRKLPPVLMNRREEDVAKEPDSPPGDERPPMQMPKVSTSSLKSEGGSRPTNLTVNQGRSETDTIRSRNAEYSRRSYYRRQEQLKRLRDDASKLQETNFYLSREERRLKTLIQEATDLVEKFEKDPGYAKQISQVASPPSQPPPSGNSFPFQHVAGGGTQAQPSLYGLPRGPDPPNHNYLLQLLLQQQMRLRDSQQYSQQYYTGSSAVASLNPLGGLSGFNLGPGATNSQLIDLLSQNPSIGGVSSLENGALPPGSNTGGTNMAQRPMDNSASGLLLQLLPNKLHGNTSQQTGQFSGAPLTNDLYLQLALASQNGGGADPTVQLLLSLLGNQKNDK